MKGFSKVMKTLALSLAVTTAVAATPAYVQAEETEQKTVQALTDADFLKADGKNLRNNSGTGDIVNLRGTNAGGLFVQEFWMTPTESTANVNDQAEIMSVLTERFGADKMYELVDAYETAYWTEEDFDNCAAMGMNCIRAPFWWRNLVDENGDWYGYDANADDPYTTAFEKLDWFIQEASERGLYVVVDFHGVPGSQNGSDHSGVDGGEDKVTASEFWFGENAETNQQLFYDMWEVIADRYAGNPAVAAYDLMNEPFCTYRYNSPNGLSGDELHEMLWGVYDEAYKIIRSKDADHVVIMEAVWDAGDLPNPAVYGWENVMYEYHNYLYDDYDNASGGQISNMESKLNGIGNADYNVPSYMGEFSYFNSLDAWDEGLELLVNSGINWTTWTYKTIDYYGNWGLYHHPVSMDTGINLETASYEEILAAWQKVGTSEGNANTGLIEKVSKWCNADTAANAMGPKYADIKAGTYYFLGNSSQRVLTNTGDENGNMIGAIGLSMTDTDDVKFELVHNDDGTISLKSLSNNKYISVGDDSLLRATADAITDSEKFYMMQTSATAVGLKSVKTQLFACVDEDLEKEEDYFTEGFPIIADRSSATSWESFNVYTLDGDLVGDISDGNYSGWTHYETEDTEVATIVGGKLEEQDFYSGGQAAGAMNNDGIDIAEVAADWSNINYAAFNVNVDAAGSYKLVMTYNGDDDKNILVKVGDGEAATVEVPRLGDGTWNILHEKLITVDLEKGENTIYISGTIGDGWMNLDCIDLVNAPIKKNANGSERLEAESYKTNGTAESQSFYSGSKGVGGLNSNTAFASIAANWSNVKYVDFTIYAEKAGDYIVTWAWNGNGADGMKAAYSVNKGENVALTLDNDGAAWNSMNSTEFKVTLKKGFNDLRLSGTLEEQSNWANIDYIDVVNEEDLVEVVELPKAVSGWARFEGELAATLVNGGNIEVQDFYSNGKAIGGLSTDDVAIDEVDSDWSNIPYAEFTVNAAQTGDYRMLIAYNGDDDKTVALKVNDGETQTISVPAVSSDHMWNVVHEKGLVVTLAEGENIIRISGALGGGWWNIDNVDIANAPIAVDVATGAERYEAEDFTCKSANNPSAEHQDFYSGAAENNGVGGMGATDKTFTVGSDILGTKLNYIDYSIFAEKAGTYDITVAGNGNGSDMTCVYQLNGAASESFQLLNAGQSWDHMVTATIRVTLKEGYNQLILAGTYDGDWLNYDYIDVAAVTDGEEPHTHSGGKATCISQAICDDCKQPYGEVDKNNHTGNTEIRDAVEATATKDGYTGDTYCKDCGAKLKTGTTIPATGEDKPAHTHSGGKATCISPAKCSGCGQTYGSVDKNNHTGGTEIKGKVEATATRDGYTGDTYCKGCGAKIATGTTIPKTGSTDSGDSGNGGNDEAPVQNGWYEKDGAKYWYENGVRQGYDPDNAAYRGKEIYDRASDAWYWLDNVLDGAIAKSKDVYQESAAGDWGDVMGEDGVRYGKWVRYDEDGHMVKGWQTTDAGTYYFDEIYGTMAKGYATIDHEEYYFNPETGVLEYKIGEVPEFGWKNIDGKDYWYENYIRQGYSVDASYRGKEIYDGDSDAWYWLDNIQEGAKATSKDVYQESLAGTWGDYTNAEGELCGKWVRYDESGHMIKGWQTTDAGTYYFDLMYGTMAKGNANIDGVDYYFDPATGIRQ